MAATILPIRNVPLPESSTAVEVTPPSGEEVAFHRLGFRVHLGGRSLDRTLDLLASQQMERTLTPRPSRTLGRMLPLPAQVGIAVSHFDLEIAHYAARLRLLRDLSQKYAPANSQG